MARKPRIHYPGAVYHVMLRGNGGADIFFEDGDRHRFFLLLQEGIERFGFRVHAFCLMSNHIHLALQVGEIPLSRIMQNLSFRYTQWINWRTKKKGHLFQGRYRAILVEEDEYLLQLVAYLHLNPARAGMEKTPSDYRWSSHRAYLGDEQIPWLSCDSLLSRLSKKIKPARRIFVDFVSSQAGLGHRKEFHGAVSSQYLSGLMMAAPIAHASRQSGQTMRIGVVGELVSRPYVDMTAAVMRCFGASVDVVNETLAPNQSVGVEIGPNHYLGTRYDIEPDASAASYFWASAAITGGQVKVDGLSRNAIQGDVGFCDVLAKMGCDVEFGDDFVSVTGRPLRGVDVDMNEISDTVQTLSVVALFATGPTRVRGVAHNRFKETDRIGDLACELRKFGATIDEHEDGLTIHPPGDTSDLHGATIETYDDHRMAMSLSLAGLRISGVRILNPACTSKTYPDYFADVEVLIKRPHRWSDSEEV
jgi:REP element-mobilizing transposase RayT